MIGIGLHIANRVVGGGVDAQAQAHYNRVIADGGVVPAGLNGVNAFFTAVKTIYGTSDITTAVSVGLDAQYLGYKLGAGAGATLGQAAQKLYSCAGSSGDVVQTTAASQPLLLAHNGASSDNYWYGSGVSGNFLSTPNASANQITGDIEIISKKTKIKDYTGTYAIVSKGDQASNRGWVLRCSAGTLAFLFSQTGTGMVSAVATVTLSEAGYAADTLFFFKVTRLSSSGTVKFFGSTDGITYNQIGADVTVATGAMFNSTGQVCIGSWNNDSNHFLGSIGGVTIANSIGGTPVVDFNPATYNASTSQTQWTSTTGEVWTINTGTATTGYKGALVDRTIVQSDGIDDTLVMPSNVGLTAPITLYTSFRGYSDDGSSGKSIFGYSNIEVAITRFNLSNVVAWFGNGGLSSKLFTLAGISDKILLAMAIRRNGTCELSVNNATPVTGTQATSIVDGKIGISVAGFSNASFRTGVVILGADNATKQTAMYNYIRSLNNNAF